MLGEAAPKIHLRVLHEATRQQHVRTERHGPPPEFAQPLANDAEVLDVLRVLGRSDGRHDLVQHQLDRPHPRPERYLGKDGPVITTHPTHSDLHPGIPHGWQSMTV